MKEIEKTKTQKIISKIEKGNFDENDVDNLFMKLRAYSKGNHIFREVADFVAHNDERGKGIANQSLEAFYLSIKFFNEYVSEKKSIDISKPFPSYIKKLMKYQVDKCNDSDLLSKFNVKKQRLKSRIDSLFSEDKKRKLVSLRKAKISDNNLKVIQFLLSFIGSHPAFNQEELFNEIIKVVSSNKLEFDENLFLAQSQKLTVCVLLLLHDTSFKYKGHKPGYCKISCEKTAIPHNQRFVDSENNLVDHQESFGALQIIGCVILDKDGKDLTVCFPLMTTNLFVDDWCDENLFNIEPLSEKHPQFLNKKVNFDQNLTFSAEGKLSAALTAVP